MERAKLGFNLRDKVPNEKIRKLTDVTQSSATDMEMDPEEMT